MREERQSISDLVEAIKLKIGEKGVSTVDVIYLGPSSGATGVEYRFGYTHEKAEARDVVSTEHDKTVNSGGETKLGIANLEYHLRNCNVKIEPIGGKGKVKISKIEVSPQEYQSPSEHEVEIKPKSEDLPGKADTIRQEIERGVDSSCLYDIGY